MKKSFPIFGNRKEEVIPNFWQRECEAGIPGNGREQEFPLTPGTNGATLKSLVSKTLISLTYSHTHAMCQEQTPQRYFARKWDFHSLPANRDFSIHSKSLSPLTALITPSMF